MCIPKIEGTHVPLADSVPAEISRSQRSQDLKISDPLGRIDPRAEALSELPGGSRSPGLEAEGASP